MQCFNFGYLFFVIYEIFLSILTTDFIFDTLYRKTRYVKKIFKRKEGFDGREITKRRLNF